MSAKTHCDGVNCTRVMADSSQPWYELRVYKNEGDSGTYYYRQQQTLDLCPDCYNALFGNSGTNV